MAAFDALKELCDYITLDKGTIAVICQEILLQEVDDDDKRRAALLGWSISNGNNDSPDDVTDAGYGENTFKLGGAEYMVLTDEEADEVCAERIKDSLWAFNADFLSGETGIDSMVFSALSDKCEGANDAVESIIRGSCGLDAFVESAASADGRGHFISSYDGEEDDYCDFYIYRVN